jgi:transcription-repair coupling factor (superfamily II helicase)
MRLTLLGVVKEMLNSFINILGKRPEFQSTLFQLQNGQNTSADVIEVARPYVIATLGHNLNYPILVVTTHANRVRQVTEELENWCNQAVISIPEPDLLPYQQGIKDKKTVLERLGVLAQMVGLGRKKPFIFVASAHSFVSQYPCVDSFKGSWKTVKTGLNIEPLALVNHCQHIGYISENVVEIPGQISRRGGIVDIFPLTSELPVRVEFFGNTVEQLRRFDPESQRSRESIDTIEIGPVSELILGDSDLVTPMDIININLGERNTKEKIGKKEDLDKLKIGERPENMEFWSPYFIKDNLINYLHDRSLIILEEPMVIRQHVEHIDIEAKDLKQNRIVRGEIPPNYPRPYFLWGELKQALKRRTVLEMEPWQGKEGINKFSFRPIENYTGQFPSFLSKLSNLVEKQKTIAISTHQSQRLNEILKQESLNFQITLDMTKALKPGCITISPVALENGWILDEEIYLFSDKEIFGFVKQKRVKKHRPLTRQKLYVDINPGDYVVHIDHGIAHFKEITTLVRGGGQREYLVLEYGGGDKLYVPTDQIDRLNRYIGASDGKPVLSRLGTIEWKKRRREATLATETIARELIELYAARELEAGYAYSPDSVWQQELEVSFPYTETSDQLETSATVKKDMENTRPMDRLVMGDVGYGKTEVAVRAAFKAVMDGRQVAVLVPTTILAEQHLRTFCERLAAFPVKIEMLSRFKTLKEQFAILGGLSNGSIDICIGTHRLIQPDVTFKDLGLVIIDEEQRFGVGHKEYLKRITKDLDVLTLSATPIPRTLYLSLANVRDISMVQTPPSERQPIKTYVSTFNERMVREAVLREVERDGQVFYVHNRVNSIEWEMEKLARIIPEVRIAFGHGQMPEHKLENVMTGFARGDIDVLVCTTIIESGLDVPNANTLIVNQADKYGLTQLHQLRGRVGRGSELAYAYFFYDKGKRLSPNALKRLRTIYETNELGSGFGIAMKDLEIRGAGNILGVKQSGHISAVGFNLYTQLLAQKVEELKAKRNGKTLEEVKMSQLSPPTIDLPLKALIPSTYIPDVNTRLEIYRCLTGIKNEKELEQLRSDFVDRFGQIPDVVWNLLFMMHVRLIAHHARVSSISTEMDRIIIRLVPGLEIPKKRVESLNQGVKVGRNQLRLDLNKLDNKWKEVLIDVLLELEK